MRIGHLIRDGVVADWAEASRFGCVWKPRPQVVIAAGCPHAAVSCAWG